MTRTILGRRLLLTTAALAAVASAGRAGDIYPHYYFGVDTRPTVEYQGAPLANPNAGRLTFLYAHTYPNPVSNHYHSIGSYSLSGPAASPTILDTNAGNRIPEAYQQAAGLPPLSLLPGSGVHAGQLVSGLDTGNEYEGLLMQSVKTLDVADPTDPRSILFNSSGGRWAFSLAGAQIEMELISASAGLGIADSSGSPLFAGGAGSRQVIGQGDGVSFLPIFTVNQNAAPGSRYSAEFRLHDMRAGGGFGSSGRFFLDFQAAADTSAIPEPGTLALLTLGGGAGALGLLRRRTA